MVMMYHGTTTKRAVNIAGVGAILSPSEQRLARMRAFYAESSGRTFEEMYPGKTMKEVAIEMAAKGYAERELEHRVKAVSLDKRFHIAEGYASHGDNYPVGGIILGLDIGEEVFRRLGFDPQNACTIFVPERVDLLGALKEVYLSPRAKQNWEIEVREAFDGYDPSYHFLERV